MSDTYEFNPDFIAQRSFHGKTCGECAWSMTTTDSCKFICRRSNWCVVNIAERACPAFVAKGYE